MPGEQLSSEVVRTEDRQTGLGDRLLELANDDIDGPAAPLDVDGFFHDTSNADGPRAPNMLLPSSSRRFPAHRCGEPPQIGVGSYRRLASRCLELGENTRSATCSVL
jgi:hypothetical protein